MAENYAVFANQSFSWRFIERPALDRALSNFDYTSESRIFDVGSGIGRIISYHIERGADAANITAVEPSLEFINLARDNLAEVTFINQPVQAIKTFSQGFDLITAILSLRYLSNVELLTTLRNLHSNMNSGGTLCLLDVHPARYALTDGSEQYFNEGVREVKTPWGGSEEYYYRTLGAYVSLVAEAGFFISLLDECPLSPNAIKYDEAQFKSYAITPARFMITATK